MGNSFRDTIESRHGGCPLCQTTGDVAERCSTKACSKREIHFIPLSLAKMGYLRSQRTGINPYLGRLVGDCLIVDEVGHGAFGTVLLALQRPMLMPVAVKVLDVEATDPGTKQVMRSYAVREAKNLARMSHPNIVHLKRFAVYRDRPYIVMEYVQNAVELSKFLQTRYYAREMMTTGLLRHIFQQICNALECAHDAQVIHRDIKPSNIMIQSIAGDDSFVKILDFGLSKLVASSARTGNIAGTPRYMAPEQINGAPVTPSTDLYALSLMLIELLTGARPDGGLHRDAIFALRQTREMDTRSFPPASWFPERFHEFFTKALARTPEERFPNVTSYRPALTSVFDALALLAPDDLLTRNVGQLYCRRMAELDADKRERTHRDESISTVRSVRVLVANPHQRCTDALPEISALAVKPRRRREDENRVTDVTAMEWDNGQHPARDASTRPSPRRGTRSRFERWRAPLVFCITFGAMVTSAALVIDAIHRQAGARTFGAWVSSFVAVPSGRHTETRHLSSRPSRRPRATEQRVEIWRESAVPTGRRPRRFRQPSVSITSTPIGAEVYLGGSFVGLTPLRISARRKRIRLVIIKPHYEPLRERLGPETRQVHATLVRSGVD